MKRFLTKLLFPPMVLVVLLIPVSAAGLIYAFAVEDALEYVAYGMYAVSAYTLTVVCTRAPAVVRQVKKIKQENKYISRYFQDPHLRVKLSLYGTVALNTLYGVMQLFSGFYYHSVWFYALAGYYGLLAVMRYLLLKETVRESPRENLFMELLHYRLCGVVLLLMNLTLMVIVAYTVFQNRGHDYHEIYTIALAAYTFTTMAIAIKNVIKYRRYESPVMSAAKVLSLVSALVSMLSLEAAMLTVFGEETQAAFRQLMTGLTGIGVCLLVLIMAIYMIITSTGKIKTMREGVNQDE